MQSEAAASGPVGVSYILSVELADVGKLLIDDCTTVQPSESDHQVLARLLKEVANQPVGDDEEYSLITAVYFFSLDRS